MKYVYAVLLSSSLILSGCSSSPIYIEHEDGKLPKLRVKLPKGKLRVRTDHKFDYLNVIWEYQFKIDPAIIDEEID